MEDTQTQVIKEEEVQWVYGHKGASKVQSEETIGFTDKFALLVPNSPVDWIIFGLLIAFATIFALYIKHEWEEEKESKLKQKKEQGDLLKKAKELEALGEEKKDEGFFLPG